MLTFLLRLFRPRQPDPRLTPDRPCNCVGCRIGRRETVPADIAVVTTFAGAAVVFECPDGVLYTVRLSLPQLERLMDALDAAAAQVQRQVGRN